MFRLRVLGFVALPLVLASCSDAVENISGLDPIGIARIELSATSDTIVVQDTLTLGDTVRIGYAVLMKSGELWTDVPLVWRSSNPAAAIVDSTGLVTAQGFGITQITASAGRESRVSITVVPAFDQDTLPNVFVAVAAGGETTCMRTNRLRLFCTGRGESSQLGSAARDTVCENAYIGGGAEPCTLVPLRVNSALRFASVVVGQSHACALTGDGIAHCWGSGESGQRGDGTIATAEAPKLTSTQQQFTALTAGLAHTCGIDTNQKAWCWGADAAGQLGNSLVAGSTTPIPVDGNRSWTQFSAGASHTCGIEAGGALWCWGANNFGQLGTGDTDPANAPVAVLAGQTFSAVAAGRDFTCALTTGGNVLCWGRGDVFQLGGGGAVPFSTSPVNTGLSGATAIVAGSSHACALQGGGALCWGTYDLALARGPMDAPLAGVTPVAVPGATELASLTSGARHACGATAEGQVRCWGSNVFGPFGDGLQALLVKSATPMIIPPR